jgi:ParB family transcriptional regulator, chromosome partitioning protein
MDVVNEMVMVKTGAIKPYHRNPRKNDVTVDKLVELIPKVGFNVPLVLDRSNVIVKGHTRWRAAVRLKMPAIPCVYTDADEETVKLDRLADNRVQEFSTWDQELLGGELASLNLDFAFDLGTLDFVLADNRRRPGAEAVVMLPDGQPGREETLPAVRDGGEAGGGAPPYISDADVRATYSLPVSEYDEATCDKCGNHMFIRRRA